MEKKKISEAQIRATEKYQEKAYFKALVRFKKDDEDLIRSYAGDSLNGFIVAAVKEKIEREKAKEKEEAAAGPFDDLDL